MKTSKYILFSLVFISTIYGQSFGKNKVQYRDFDWSFIQTPNFDIYFYGDNQDVLILISSSGRSKNMINACKAAKEKKIEKIITFTGHDENNPLSKLGDLNIWINSKAYNFVENTHQLWLLTICDLIIGKREYLPN